MGHGGERKGAGRKTADPKGHRLSVRLAPRDVKALEKQAARFGGSLAEAARFVLRLALGVEHEKQAKKHKKPKPS